MAATFKNFALAVLAAPLAVGQTTAELAGADAMPQISGAASHYYAVLQMPGDTSQVEIVKVTSNPVNDVVTIERAQEGTVERAFPVGALFENRVTLRGMAEAYVSQAAPVFESEIDATSGVNIRAAIRSTSLTGAAKEVLQAAGTEVLLGNANASVSLVANSAPKVVIGGEESTLLHSGDMGVGSGIDAEKLGGKSYTLWGALDEAERVQEVWNFAKGFDVENANGQKFLALRGTSEYMIGLNARTIQIGDGTTAVSIKSGKIVIGYGLTAVLQAEHPISIQSVAGAKQKIIVGEVDSTGVVADSFTSKAATGVNTGLVITPSDYPTLRGEFRMSAGNPFMGVWNTDTNSWSAYLRPQSDGTIEYSHGGTTQQVYHTGNKPSADDVGLGNLRKTVSDQLVITTSHGYTVIGMLNDSWSHYDTSAAEGHYFYQKMQVAGELRAASTLVTVGKAYLNNGVDVYGNAAFNNNVTIAGELTAELGVHVGLIPGTWIGGFRDVNPAIHISTVGTISYSPWMTQRTPNGGFSFGTLADSFHLKYATNADIDSNTNAASEMLVVSSAGDVTSGRNHYANTFFAKSGTRALVSHGNSDQGIDISPTSKNTIVGGGHSGSIYLRPNGIPNSDGQVYLAATGAIVTSGSLTIGDAYARAGGASSSHGSIDVAGVKGGYAGIYFRDMTRTLMVTGAVQGFYSNATSAWQWYFNNGVLTAGSVPWTRITGQPSTYTPPVASSTVRGGFKYTFSNGVLNLIPA